MENPIHKLGDLFQQLGLPDDAASIERFIASHRLPDEVLLADAPFWTTGQAQFLREELCKDGDWAEWVDALGSLLSRDNRIGTR